MTTFWNPLTDPLENHHGPPLVRGPQFENGCIKQCVAQCLHLDVG